MPRLVPHLINLLIIGAVTAAFFTIGSIVVGDRLFSGRESISDDELTPIPGARFIQSATGRIHIIDAGEGPAILLLHGSGRSLTDWNFSVIERLARNHRVIAIDLFGMGSSERNPAFRYGYDLWAKEAIETLDLLNIDQAVVVGHSVGGAIACIIAADFPERIRGVVTVGTGMEIEPQQFLLAAPIYGEFTFANLDYYGRAYSDDQEKVLVDAFRVRGTRRALVEYMRRQMTFDGLRLVFGVFEHIKAPVLHISGSEDRSISPDAARSLSKRTGGEFVSFSGASHDVPMEMPDKLAEQVSSFVDKLPAAKT